MHEDSINVAGVIPYENFKEKMEISKREVEKGRHVEVWGNLIYTAEKWWIC